MPDDRIIEIDASQARSERDLTRLMRKALGKPTPFQQAQHTVRNAIDQWWKDNGYVQ